MSAVPNDAMEASQWFTNNLPWLRKWLGCFIITKPSESEQVFRTNRTFYMDTQRCPVSEAEKLLKASLDDEFIPKVLYTLVFGVNTTRLDPLYDPKLYRTIDGFLAKEGRLPTPSDHVKINSSMHGDIGAAEGPSEITWYRHWRIGSIEIRKAQFPPPEPDPATAFLCPDCGEDISLEGLEFLLGVETVVKSANLPPTRVAPTE